MQGAGLSLRVTASKRWSMVVLELKCELTPDPSPTNHAANGSEFVNSRNGGNLKKWPNLDDDLVRRRRPLSLPKRPSGARNLSSSVRRGARPASMCAPIKSHPSFYFYFRCFLVLLVYGSRISVCCFLSSFLFHFLRRFRVYWCRFWFGAEIIEQQNGFFPLFVVGWSSLEWPLSVRRRGPYYSQP